MSKAEPSGPPKAVFSDRPSERWLSLLESLPAPGIWSLLAFGSLALVPVIVAPLDLTAQFAFGIALFLFTAVLNRWSAHWISVAMCVLSVVVSTRYLYWRITETLTFETFFGAFLGLGLLLAEIYAWLILLLGYFQTSTPLDRPATPLPEDIDLWPTVDVYIATYNESLEIVRDTILGAANIDYPADKLRVYVLDDGRRAEFRAFCEAAGVGYITRPDNAHAKAGNLNHALTRTDGELICIFDADHVPTKSFLQMTVGGFLTDAKLALVQTPHHFFTPDPFERNIRGGEDVPNEGELFYGPVQKGNDLWNAAFFCGSCAVIRRQAVEEVGGVAVETVTEDAHTALKMQKRGWNTAYIDVPLAAGRATERFVLHVGQRVRWARGMTQILRQDSPLIGGKLTLAQRLCYLNAMLHFQFALPRIVFLTAPLAFLILDQNIIASTAPMVLAYAGPHLMHALLTNSRLQGKYRLNFWGELYETALSFYLLRPVVAALINPRLGKFNVTDKGGLLDRDYFDFRIAKFHLITLGLILIGTAYGSYRLVEYWDDANLRGVLLLNIGWAVYNVIVLLGAMAAAFETRQIRRSVRFSLVMPVTVFTETDHVVYGETINISTGGALIRLPPGASLNAEDIEMIELPVAGQTHLFPVEAVASKDGVLRIRFPEMPIEDYRRLVDIVFGRLDAWVDRGHTGHAKTPPAIVSLLYAASGIFRLPRRNVPAPAEPVEEEAARPAPNVPGAGIAVMLALALALGLTGGRDTAAQTMPDPPSAAVPQADAFPSPPAAPTPSALPPAAPAAPALPALAAPAPSLPTAPGTRLVTVSLKDLGAQEPLRLSGVQAEVGFPVDIRNDEVVTAAKITLSLAYSPSLLSELSHLSALVNGEIVGTLRLEPNNAGGLTVQIPVNPALFVRYNRFGVRAVQHYSRECEDPLHSSLWTILSNQSAIELTLQSIQRRLDLAALPAPFIDAADRSRQTVAVALPGNPSPSVLQSAAIATAYFAKEASYRGIDFPTSLGRLPAGNALVLAMPSAPPPGLTLPSLTGPALISMANPNGGRLLIVAGRNEEELKTAATVLSIGAATLTGTSMTVDAPFVQARLPYDAPNWIPTDRPVAFGELTEASALQGAGLIPGKIVVPFRTAPDLFLWGNRGIPVTVGYRYPQADWLNLEQSRLDVLINGIYLKTLPIRHRTVTDELRDLVRADHGIAESSLKVPPFAVFGKNQLEFSFAMQPAGSGSACMGGVPGTVLSGITPESTIDFSDAERFTVMPDLSHVVSAGFPFTRLADLSDTAALLPLRPNEQEIQAFLTMIGRFSEFTGFPPLRLQVISGPANLRPSLAKNLLVIGTLDDRLPLGDMTAGGPVQMAGNRLSVAQGNLLERALHEFAAYTGDSNPRDAANILLSAGSFTGLVGQRRRVAGDDWSTVMVLSSHADRLPALVASLDKADVNAAVQGDLAIIDDTNVHSFRVGPTYTVGELSLFSRIRWETRDHPLLLAASVIGGSLLIAVIFYSLVRRLARSRLRRQKGA